MTGNVGPWYPPAVDVSGFTSIHEYLFVCFAEVLQHIFFVCEEGRRMPCTNMDFFTCVFLSSLPESKQGLTLQSPTRCSDADRQPACMEKLFHIKGDSVLLMRDTIFLKSKSFTDGKNTIIQLKLHLFLPAPPSRIQDMQGTLKERTGQRVRNSLRNSANTHASSKRIICYFHDWKFGLDQL